MELRVRCEGFIMRAVKLHPPKLFKQATSSPISPIFPFDLNSSLSFHSAWSQGPFIPSYPLAPFCPLFLMEVRGCMQG